MDFERYWSLIQIHGVDFAIRIVSALVIYFAGKIALRIVVSMLQKFLTHRKIDATISRFLENAVKTVFNIFIFLAVLARLGIQTTSFIAILGAASLAVGLALQGALSNFSSGILIMLFRPFKVGDVIETSGSTGGVETIGLLTTELLTPDKRQIIIPNSKVMSDKIINYSAMETRRVDLKIGVSYSDDLKKAKDVITAVVKKNKFVLEEPAPAVFVAELADSSVNLAVRPWVKTPDYWDCMGTLVEEIKLALDENGISIPFPQTDVHLFQK
ncbi:mechanosensitive ion channel [Myxococcota bacterium]|nr:mechanosensitive ion channel [Myxococcota bacterium]MBU1379638.1 mechanosensitive ion channel [Myxococcota bacterium]MBU1498005.1 mechanosensitive ion channel [Myxococcota bacterium]